MKVLKSIFINFIDIILFLIIVPYKMISYGKQINTDNFSELSLFIPSFASILFLISISILFGIKKRSRFLYACDLVISFLIISDLNYFRYFKDVISIPVIINGLQLGAVESSVKTLMKPSDILYAIDLFILPLINRYIKKENFESAFNPGFKNKLILSLCIFTVGLFVDFKYFYNLSKEQPRLLSTMYNKVYITKKLGIVNYHYTDIYNTVYNKISRLSPVSKNEQSEMKSFFHDNKSAGKNFHNAYKGKNLIVIQVEALQGFVIGSSIDGHEITPNLNKFITKSEYFDNFHYQTAAGGTSDAEFMTNNSLYPAQSGAAYFLYSGNKFQSMPEQFYKNNYETAAFHGFRESFWNRNVMYRNFKFNKFYSEKSFKNNETVGLGLSDRSFLEQSSDKLEKLKNPYYAFLITLSSHFPYDDVKDYGNFNVGNLEGSLIGNYIKAIHYTDKQLGMFLDKLDKNGALKDSVIVIYGDHYAIPKNKQDQFLKFYNKKSLSEVDWIKLQKVPLIMHFPDEKLKGVNHTVSGEMDIYPTIINLFGLNSDYTMGHDLFNTENGNIIYRDGSFINGNYYYMSESNNFYDLSSGKKLSEDKKLNNEKVNYLNQLKYSDDLLKHNLLKKWLK